MFLFMDNVLSEPFIDNSIVFMIKYNLKCNQLKVFTIL